MGTQNLEVGGIRLIEVLDSDGNVVYRESSYGSDTEVPLLIGMYLEY